MENISPTAFNVFDEARSLGEHTDLIIRANDREFQVHKIILCGCSPYFRVLFSSNWTRIPEQFYDIPGMSRNIMSLIIQYAYTGSVFITEENVLELLVAADQFLVSGLVDACCQFLESRFCPENCIGICMFTEDFHSCSKLRHKAKLYILQHFEEVLQVSEEFLELSVEQLEEIIDKDELNVKQEEVVFEAVLHWIDHAPESRRKHIAMLLPKVRMGLMTSDYFINNVKSNALVMENEACMPLIINAMKALFEFDMDLHGPISLELIHQLTRPRLPSAILLAIGGWSNGSPSNVIEAYDANAGRWVNVTLEDERPRAYHGTAVLHEFVYSVGGYDSVEYFNSVRKLNLITQTWHEVAPMYERRCYVSVAVLDGFIYAIGGFDGHVRLKSTERYDPDTNQWTLTTSMNERRSDASATSLQGRVYICGGFTGTECLFSAESFNPDTNQWTLIAPMRSRRSGVGVIAYGDLVYAVGGFDGASRLRSAETYNPLTNIWCDTASMYNPRSNFGIEVVDDQLFAVGGFNGFSTTSDAECYDKKTNEWFDANEMAVFRSALNCCVISGLPNMAQYAAQRDAVQIQDGSDSE
ncbi:kelch-like protein 10 [Sinocyclocheilus grahami]|uniref:kelch-like protein 10 n=1 Tax=Sinocyclocheilus grahami TaxID=75366 RepID=UPI0007ACB993|nr:PREDICTED: kelch-like protein 10 [Sinocyclocheilus grahami]